MRAVMVLVVMGVLVVLCGCEKHIKEVRDDRASPRPLAA